ncbi:MAG: Rpn family recombination-promoting nuclease/putative transposase [Rickettsiales bacterium]
MSSNRITHAHDAFVRTVMSDPRVARDFFLAHLPKDLCEVIDINHLVLQPRSYINDVRKESTVDMLYETIIAGQSAYLYLIVEHQSTPDVLMPFRMLKYVCNVMDHYVKVTQQKKLPLVYPMVIYHAERPYPYSTDIKDNIDAPMELIDRYFLKPFQLIDLGQIDDEELKQHAWAGVMEFILKHIFARDVLPYLQDIAGFLKKITQSGGHDYVSIVLQYALERGELKDKRAFFDLINTKISSEVGEKIMTLAEQIKAEGIAEGIQKGIQKGITEGVQKGITEGVQMGKFEAKLEVAERLFKEGVELIFVSKITGISLERLTVLQKESVQ